MPLLFPCASALFSVPLDLAHRASSRNARKTNLAMCTCAANRKRNEKVARKPCATTAELDERHEQTRARALAKKNNLSSRKNVIQFVVFGFSCVCACTWMLLGLMLNGRDLAFTRNEPSRNMVIIASLWQKYTHYAAWIIRDRARRGEWKLLPKETEPRRKEMRRAHRKPTSNRRIGSRNHSNNKRKIFITLIYIRMLFLLLMLLFFASAVGCMLSATHTQNKNQRRREKIVQAETKRKSSYIIR